MCRHVPSCGEQELSGLSTESKPRQMEAGHLSPALHQDGPTSADSTAANSSLTSVLSCDWSPGRVICGRMPSYGEHCRAVWGISSQNTPP